VRTLSEIELGGKLTPQHKQTKPPELSASPVVPNPVEQVDTDNQLAHQVATALSLLKGSTVNPNKPTDNSLNKVNMALRPALRDITVLNPVNLVRQAKVNMDPSLNLDHHTALLLVYLLDLDNLLREHTDNSPRVSTDNNPDKDRGSTDNSLGKGNMDNSLGKGSTANNLDKDSTVSSQDKDRVNTVNNLLKVNTVNKQAKGSTVNNLLKDSMVSSLQLQEEEESMLGTSLPFYSSVSRM